MPDFTVVTGNHLPDFSRPGAATAEYHFTRRPDPRNTQTLAAVIGAASASFDDLQTLSPGRPAPVRIGEVNPG